MDQQQTIIAAMTKLDEFTVADIVDATGAISSTVRTVLRRNEGLVERIGVLGEDRRGGRWIRYRVRKGADVELPPEPAAVAPDTILAALGLLIDELPDAATPRARELLLRARSTSSPMTGVDSRPSSSPSKWRRRTPSSLASCSRSAGRRAAWRQ